MAQTTTHSPQSNIRVMQINAGRGFITTAEIRHYAEKFKIDVVAIQEPYTFRGKIANFGGRSRTITGGHQNDNAWAAIVVFNPNLTVMKLSHLCNQHIVCAQIDNGAAELFLVSGYFQFSRPISTFIEQTKNILRSLRGRTTILCLDVNA